MIIAFLITLLSLSGLLYLKILSGNEEDLIIEEGLQ